MNKPTPLSAEKQRLLAQRLKGSVKPQGAPQIPTRAQDRPAPLSFAQYPLWLIDQMTPGNAAYNIPVAYLIRGDLDAHLLEESFHQIMERHEVWRTTFDEVEGEVVQVIHPTGKVEFGVRSLTHLPAAERLEEMRELVAQEAVRPFDLRCLPLVRVALFQLSPEEQVLLVNVHHIVADGVSLSLLFAELDVIYRALLSGATPRLPELKVHYADFAAWQKVELLKPAYATQLEYWRQQLRGDLPLLDFGGIQPRPTRQSFRGSNVDFALSKATAQSLTTLGMHEGGTLFVVILAVLEVILLRHSQAEEIVVGMPIANRPLLEVSRSLGDFVNVVALRCDLSGDPTFLDLLRRSRETVLNALSNKDIPFGMLAENLKSHQSAGHNPVFQVLLQILPADRAKIGELEIAPFPFETRAAQVDLALHLYEQSDGSVLGRFQYCTDLFGRETIESLVRNFVQLSGEVGQYLQQKIRAIPLAATPPRPAASTEEPSSSVPSPALPPPRSYAPPQYSVQSQLIEIWEEVLGCRNVGIRDDFFELGGHSLLVARMLALVEERLGMRVPFGTFFHGATVEKLSLLMKDKQFQLADHSWVLLNKQGTKAPLFFLHGDFNGGGFFCRGLARALGADRPFYALHPAGLQGDSIPTTIEEMAALKLQELRRIQPKGPYLLGGYCNGAMVAYEMARQIEADGGEAPIVLMLYATGTNAPLRSFKRLTDLISAWHTEDAVQRQRRFLRRREMFRFVQGVREHYSAAAADLIKHPLAEQARRVWRKAGRIVRQIFVHGSSLNMLPAKVVEDPNREVGLDEAKGCAYFEAFFGYVPRVFGGRIVLLWPQDEKFGPPQGPTYGWKKICRDIRTVLVPGDHDSCIARDPNLQIIGEQMARALNEIEAEG